jgi:hypothetical protein
MSRSAAQRYGFSNPWICLLAEDHAQGTKPAEAATG